MKNPSALIDIKEMTKNQ